MSDLRESIMALLNEAGAAPTQPAPQQPQRFFGGQQQAAPQPPQMSIREQVAAGFRDAMTPQQPAPPQSFAELVQQQMAAPRPNGRPASDVGAPHSYKAAGLESGDPCWTFTPQTVDRMISKWGMGGAGQRLRQRLRQDMAGKFFSIRPNGK